MADEAPDLLVDYRLEPFEMKVQGLDRTLADKVFAICDYHLQNKVGKHSRHTLKAVLEGEHLAKLIDEAVAFVKADQTDHSDSDMGDIFASAKEMLDNISGKSVVMNMSTELAEYITKLYYALKAGE